MSERMTMMAGGLSRAKGRTPHSKGKQARLANGGASLSFHDSVILGVVIIVTTPEEAQNHRGMGIAGMVQAGEARNEKPALLVQSELLKPEWLRRRTAALEGRPDVID